MKLVSAGMLMLLVLAAGASHAQSIQLEQPIRCMLGKDCFIQNFVDHDTTAAHRDFTCGTLSYDKHTGTDFRLRSLNDMRAGVDVLAAAAGTVRAVRDGVDDISVRVKGKQSVQGRECGNGVVIVHPAGYESQYCHLRKGSVRVRKGQAVHAGDVLGQVGLSGATEFPHVHFELRRLGRVIDPFTASPAGMHCKETGERLWRSEAVQYIARTVLNIGISGAVESPEIWQDRGRGSKEIPRSAEALVLWAELMGPRAGDEITLRLVAQNGAVVAARTIPVPRPKATLFAYVGKKASEEGLAPGRYRGLVWLRQSHEDKPTLLAETTTQVME